MKKQSNKKRKVRIKHKSLKPTAHSNEKVTHPAMLIQAARSESNQLNPGQVLQLQRMIGNQATRKLLRANPRALQAYSRPVKKRVQRKSGPKKARKKQPLHNVKSVNSSKGGLIVQRYTYLGEESWKNPFGGMARMKVYVQSKEEWKKELKNMDDESDYERDLEGFLKVSNDPGIVGHTRAPHHVRRPGDKYKNTVTRAPTNSEKLEFLRALYEMKGDLDLWHGSIWEGGSFVRYADRELATFLRKNQSMLIAEISAKGEVISSKGVKAIAGQGGKAATMAMIMNAGATAHKGVDLVMTANKKSGRARETAHSIAMETVRNSGRVIRAALEEHDARVKFQQKVVGSIFDTVWGMIPGGGALVSAGMDILKAGLKEGLDKAQEEDKPKDQAEKINDKFVAACNKLVKGGHIKSADAQDAINGFEAVRR